MQSREQGLDSQKNGSNIFHAMKNWGAFYFSLFRVWVYIM